MVNFITKLLLVAEKDVILVICNRLSKMTHFIATTEGKLVKELVRLFRNNVWKLHRLPESVILDRGPQFTVELTKELNRMLGIEMELLTLFHSQTDGQTVIILLPFFHFHSSPIYLLLYFFLNFSQHYHYFFLYFSHSLYKLHYIFYFFFFSNISFYPQFSTIVCYK